MPDGLDERLHIIDASPLLLGKTADQRPREIVVGCTGVSAPQCLLLVFIEAMLTDVLCNDHMQLIKRITWILEEVLREQDTESGKHSPFVVFVVEVCECETGLKW